MTLSIERVNVKIGIFNSYGATFTVFLTTKPWSGTQTKVKMPDGTYYDV